ELDIRISWKGKGKDEQGYDQKNRRIVAVDPRYFRPAEVDSLLGDASKARQKLGWAPKVRYAELVAEMVREDLKEAQREELTKKHGFDTPDRHE
ncbi:MAG TPA: GDP-mannose 4,6-dehydratase, partial [Burkholderiales bacterium]|nr:GDP-mannose 4,6-dehydratase [Burkholderiales bacterium]